MMKPLGYSNSSLDAHKSEMNLLEPGFHQRFSRQNMGRASNLNRAILLIGLALVTAPPQIFAQGGVPLWIDRVHGPGIGDDSVRAVAADDSGNLFVTGSACGTNGSYPNNYDFGTVKYSGNGLPLWTNYYKGPIDSWDSPVGMVVNSSGDIFVTGGSANTNQTYDYATVAYSSSGTPLWTNRYSAPNNGNAYASSIAVDSTGSLFVTGRSGGMGTGYDYTTVACSGSGVPLWTNRFDGLGHGDDQANAIAVYGNSQVFVTGYSTRSNGYHEYATVAYSSAGDPLWTNRFSTTLVLYSGNEAYGVKVDNVGNVVVTGRIIRPASRTAFQYVTIKYSNSGVPQWTNYYDAADLSYYPRQPIALDGSGNIFVIGVSENTNSWDYTLGYYKYDYATIKYSDSGTPLWTNRYNGSANDYDTAHAVAVDTGGTVYVTGGSDGATGGDFLTLAYSNSGLPLWTNRYHGPWGENDYALALVTDGSGNAIVAGRSHGTNSDYDYATIKYSSGVQPRLGIQEVNQQLLLIWTNADFTLQSAPFPAGAFTNIPGATSPFTNPISGPQQFFRLISN